jgi:tol-pal system protein YbgF
MKRIAYLFLALSFTVFLISWSGCGSSRKTVNQSGTSSDQSGEDYDEIEKLLGISRDDSKKSQPESKQSEQAKTSKSDEQDDLITLLEADEGKKTDKPVSETSPGEDKRISRLQTQVDDLQNQLEKKNMEIADLKAQVMMKDEALKNQTTTTPAPTYSYPGEGYTRTGEQLSSDSYKNRYDDALQLFHERQYQQAIEEFQQLLATDMNHSLADNAQYWIGESYYALGRYQEAIMAFEKVPQFPKSNKNDWAKFKLGQCYYQMGNKERARQEFQELLDLYPDSDLAARARNYLAQAQ